MVKTCCAAAAVLLLTLPALAQRPRGSGGGGGDETGVWNFLAEKYDADKDGKVTKSEFPRGDEKFAVHDRNKDGVITAADFAAASERGGRAQRGGRANRGGAGARPDLARSVAVAIARRADLDGDAEVTSEEWRAAIAALDPDGDKRWVAEELAGLLERGGTPRGRARGGRERGPAATVRRTALDANGDGQIDLAEMMALRDLLDVDRDGVVRADEVGPVPASAPAVGELAPDFELPTVADPEKTVTLSSFAGHKPVALIFGSYT